MRAAPEELMDVVRLAETSAEYLLYLGKLEHHDTDSCACALCASSRRMKLSASQLREEVQRHKLQEAVGSK